MENNELPKINNSNETERKDSNAENTEQNSIINEEKKDINISSEQSEKRDDSSNTTMQSSQEPSKKEIEVSSSSPVNTEIKTKVLSSKEDIKSSEEENISYDNQKINNNSEKDDFKSEDSDNSKGSSYSVSSAENKNITEETIAKTQEEISNASEKELDKNTKEDIKVENQILANESNNDNNNSETQIKVNETQENKIEVDNNESQEQNSPDNNSENKDDVSNYKNNNENDLPNNELPSFLISNNESVNSNEVKPENQTLNTEANFNQIFNVSDESLKEESTQTSNVNNENTENTNDLSINQNQNPSSTQKNENKVEDEKNITKEKNKSDIFNSEEKILYEIQSEKEGNPLAVLFFFLFLIAFILLLPTISKNGLEYFEMLRPNSNKPVQNEENDDKFYDLNSSSVRIKIEDLEFANFVESKVNNTYRITFTMTNNAQKPYMFDKKYYVVLYKDETLLYRALIHSYEALAALGAGEINLIISQRAYEQANRFRIEEINTSRYPNVELIETDGEYNVLTCTYQNDEIKYYFINSQLNRIRETYKENRNESLSFDYNLATYRSTSEKYKQIEGFTSTFVETTSDFTMINDFELRNIPDITLSNLNVYRFFKYNENKNIVSFEIQAQGYTCR